MIPYNLGYGYGATPVFAPIELMMLDETISPMLQNLAGSQLGFDPMTQCSDARKADPRDWECFCFYGDQFNPEKPHCSDMYKDPPPCDKSRIQDPNDPECVCYAGDQFNYYKPYCKQAYIDELNEIQAE